MPRATTRTSKARVRGIEEGYRSGLEETIASSLRARGVDPRYETVKIEFVSPATKHKYTPDFPLANGIIVESKGRFLPPDRKKHLLIKEQHPELDIRFVFQRSKNPITKGSKTTYADWCVKHGFTYADKDVPDSWLKEKHATA